MDKSTFRCHAVRELWTGEIALHFGFRQLDTNTLYLANPMTYTEHPANVSGATQQPAIWLRVEDAQLLMDELWACGLRPSEGTGSAGSLRATEKHLADMQKLVFTLLDVSKASEK